MADNLAQARHDLAVANRIVANEGIIEGPAAEALRYRRSIGAQDVRIFADSHVKHGAHAITADRSIGELTRDLEWSGADVVIATGQRTGDAATGPELREIRTATALPVLTGSGATQANVGEILQIADGLIVASALKVEGVWWNAVDPARARAFEGALAVARFMRGLFKPAPAKRAITGGQAEIHLASANGGPAVVAVVDGRVVGVMCLEITSEGIAAFRNQVNPDKLARATRVWAAGEHGEPSFLAF